MLSGVVALLLLAGCSDNASKSESSGTAKTSSDAKVTWWINTVDFDNKIKSDFQGELFGQSGELPFSKTYAFDEAGVQQIMKDHGNDVEEYSCIQYYPLSGNTRIELGFINPTDKPMSYIDCYNSDYYYYAGTMLEPSEFVLDELFGLPDIIPNDADSDTSCAPILNAIIEKQGAPNYVKWDHDDVHIRDGDSPEKVFFDVLKTGEYDDEEIQELEYTLVWDYGDYMLELDVHDYRPSVECKDARYDDSTYEKLKDGYVSCDTSEFRYFNSTKAEEAFDMTRYHSRTDYSTNKQENRVVKISMQ